MQRKIATLTDFLSLPLLPFEITSIVSSREETIAGRIHIQIRFDGLGSLEYFSSPPISSFPRRQGRNREVRRGGGRKGRTG